MGSLIADKMSVQFQILYITPNTKTTFFFQQYAHIATPSFPPFSMLYTEYF